MRKQFRYGVLFMTLLLGAVLAAGCGSDKKEGAEQPVLGAASQTGNVQASIRSAALDPATGSLVVTFTLLDEKGAALDPEAMISGGGRCRFYLAQIDATGNYRNYITSASGLPTNDSGGTFAAVGGGVYTYTFGKNITADPLYDATRTHTVAIQIRRDVAAVTGGAFQQTANPYFNFRPDGSAVTVTREIVSTSACNECHGSMSGHGSRKEVAFCILCHNPGVNDPDTGNSVDFKSMIHKIHMGQKLSSNVKGAVYGIAEANFKTIKYPNRTGDSFSDNTPMECVKCHKAGKDAAGRDFGKDVDKWKTNPTRENCTTCHDTVSFDGVTAMTFTSSQFDASGVFTLASTTTVTGTVHSAGTQFDDTACTSCHGGEDDLAYASVSIPGVHMLPMKSSLNTGLRFNIVSVEGAVSGQTPTVTFTVTDDSGADVTLVGGGASGTLADAVTMVLSYRVGADYDNTDASWIDGQSYVQGKRKTVSSASNSTPVNPAQFRVGNTYVVNFGAVTVPAGTGVGTIAIYGKRGVTIPTRASTAHRTAAQHITGVFGTPEYYHFDLATGAQVVDPAAQRREVVSLDKCNVCHTKINTHSRPDVKLCVMCHTPTLYLTSSAGYSGNLKDMIHGIHGASTSTALFRGVEKAEYPNDPRNCTACHISAETAMLPLPAGVSAGSLRSGTTNTSLDGTAVLPMKAACSSCHESAAWAEHMDSKTVNGVETCASCHSNGLLWSTENAHLPVQ